jgi:hypothetical protein
MTRIAFRHILHFDLSGEFVLSVSVVLERVQQRSDVPKSRAAHWGKRQIAVALRLFGRLRIPALRGWVTVTRRRSRPANRRGTVDP